MSDYRLNVDFDELVKFAARISGSGDVMTEEMDVAMDGSLLAVEEQVAARTPVNTGLLRGSIAHDIYGKAPDFYGEVFTPESLYGMPVEHGRAAGRMPNVNRLAYWIIKNKFATGKNAIRAAFALAYFIAKYGTTGAYMFRDGFAAAMPEVDTLWEQAMENTVRRLGE